MQALFGSFNLLVALLAIINPMAIAPIYLGLTQGRSKEERSRIAYTGAVAAAAIMLVSFLLGQLLLIVFGIDINAFQIAGGLLLLGMGLAMAQGKDMKYRPEERAEGEGAGSIAVVPLALPVTTGPGIISALVVYASVNHALIDIITGVLAILMASMVIYGTFRVAPMIADKLGPDGMSIVTRISGLILAAIGVKFIALGLVTLLPGLG